MRPSEEQSLESLFYSEASGRVQTLLEKFASFKANGSETDALRRTLHTLKGSAGMVGFHQEAEQIHDLEEKLLALDYREREQVELFETALMELVGRLGAGAQKAPSMEEMSFGAAAPFSLAQRLLASVSRFENLLDSWSGLSRHQKSSKDQRIRAELAFTTEMKELRKHSFGLAFGRPDDLLFGLRELIEVVAQAEGKRVELHFEARATYILREFIPELRSALVHLLSNCVVHGLESPSEREAKGKPAVGRIEITLEQLSDKLSLLVCDDGTGVDIAGLERKYRESGAARPWEDLSTGEQLNLLFDEGTSLKDKATLFAGRGVGLNSVRETARRLAGRVAFETRETGSCVRLVVPSPFFVADCLVVRSGGHLFSVFTSSLESVEEVQESSYTSLFAALGLEEKQAEPPRFVLWVKDAERKKAVCVHACIGLKELVVYPSPALDGLPEALIGLSDFGEVLQFAVDLRRLGAGRTQRLAARARRVVQAGPQVLVVDDSATTRSILVEVLSRAGYRVVEAEDGEQALQRLGEADFSLVVSDLEMPVLNGLKFLERLREDGSPHAQLPFVLFTSRDDAQSFQKALLLGADRCIGKAAFSEEGFLTLVEDLLRAN